MNESRSRINNEKTTRWQKSDAAAAAPEPDLEKFPPRGEEEERISLTKHLRSTDWLKASWWRNGLLLFLLFLCLWVVVVHY